MRTLPEGLAVKDDDDDAGDDLDLLDDDEREEVKEQLGEHLGRILARRGLKGTDASRLFAPASAVSPAGAAAHDAAVAVHDAAVAAQRAAVAAAHEQTTAARAAARGEPPRPGTQAVRDQDDAVLDSRPAGGSVGVEGRL